MKSAKLNILRLRRVTGTGNSLVQNRPSIATLLCIYGWLVGAGRVGGVQRGLSEGGRASEAGGGLSARRLVAAAPLLVAATAGRRRLRGRT